MVKLPNGRVWAYHGTSSAFADEHLEKGIPTTTFPGDWLGHGAYFWEGDYYRAVTWAEERVVPKYGGDPIVLGAVIDLRRCLDLTRIVDRGLLFRAEAEMYASLSSVERQALKQSYHRRDVDCRAVNWLVAGAVDGDGQPLYNCVRGVFWEGGPLYVTDGGHESGIRTLDHIQINVTHPSAIKLIDYARL